MSEILDFLYKTHRLAARRENASTQVLIATWESNGHDLIGAITAAMQTFGGRHAPIKKTYNFLESVKDLKDDFYPVVSCCIQAGRIPGFGSSFAKNKFDDLLSIIESKLYLKNIKWKDLWVKIRNELLLRNKNLYPNLAFYTAAACIEEGININFCEAEMLKARIEEWIKILKERP